MLSCQAPKLQCDIIQTINTFCMFSKDFNRDTTVAVRFNGRRMRGIKGLNVAQSSEPFHEQIHNLRLLLSFFLHSSYDQSLHFSQPQDP